MLVPKQSPDQMQQQLPFLFMRPASFLTLHNMNTMDAQLKVGYYGNLLKYKSYLFHCPKRTWSSPNNNIFRRRALVSVQDPGRGPAWTSARQTTLKTSVGGEESAGFGGGAYLGLSQCLMEEDTPPPQVRLHSSQGDHRPQPPSTPSGRVP